VAGKREFIADENPGNGVEEVDVDLTLVTEAPDDWEFTVHTAQTPTMVEMEDAGDKFVGKFTEWRHIVPEKGGDEFDLIIFEGRDGNPYSLSPSYKLTRAFHPEMANAIQPGTWCMVTLVQLIDTGAKQPMKDYEVLTRTK
jgi:hypothetical protein